MGAPDWNDITIRFGEIGDGQHSEIIVESIVTSENITDDMWNRADDAPTREISLARRRAAGVVARVGLAVLDQVEATRTRHGCHGLDVCCLGSVGLDTPLTGDWSLGPFIGVTVPTKEVSAWTKRLTDALRVIQEDDRDLHAVSAPHGEQSRGHLRAVGGDARRARPPPLSAFPTRLAVTTRTRTRTTVEGPYAAELRR